MKTRLLLAVPLVLFIAAGFYVSNWAFTPDAPPAPPRPPCGGPAAVGDANSLGLLDPTDVWPDDPKAVADMEHESIASADCGAKWFGVFAVDNGANCRSEWPWVPTLDPYRDPVLAYHHVVDWRRITMAGAEPRDTLSEILLTFADPAGRDDFISFARLCDREPVLGIWDTTTTRSWLLAKTVGTTRLVALAFGEFTRPKEDDVHRRLLDRAGEVAAAAK